MTSGTGLSVLQRQQSWSPQLHWCTALGSQAEPFLAASSPIPNFYLRLTELASHQSSTAGFCRSQTKGLPSLLCLHSCKPLLSKFQSCLGCLAGHSNTGHLCHQVLPTFHLVAQCACACFAQQTEVINSCLMTAEFGICKLLDAPTGWMSLKHACKNSSKLHELIWAFPGIAIARSNFLMPCAPYMANDWQKVMVGE